ncbi:LysR substrate-binding domain-containing protein [Streptomyces sp. NPDC096324]|uniref:LysR substrate-binding domain-containing protein n=1 Tax=Streptomyces sp. NPDC096324 TaxID=3366085 RepID=UPI0038298A11
MRGRADQPESGHPAQAFGGVLDQGVFVGADLGQADALVVTPADRSWDGPRAELATYAETRWIAGCERCREHLVAACGRAGFSPIVEFETDDYVAVQALVAAGLGVSLLPGLTLLANRHPGVRRSNGSPACADRSWPRVYGKPPASQPAQVLLDAPNATVSEPRWPA